MNTYLVPLRVLPSETENYILIVYADLETEAYKEAMSQVLSFSSIVSNPLKSNHYDYFDEKVQFDCNYFPISEKDDILKKIYKERGIKPMEVMDLYNYMYWGDYNAQIKKLAEKAIDEEWSFDGKDDYCILKNYLKYTFNKLQKENKVIETDSYCVFNTGLFTPYYDSIYAYGEINLNESEESQTQKWYFKGFKDEYELERLDLKSDSPKRADYFLEPERLIFNWHNKITVNYKHILDDLNTSQRLPESIKNSDTPLQTLIGVINTSIQKVIANYKLAVPHYYQDKIQLLIPLSFNKLDIPDVALVIDQLKNGRYLATTCLSLEMAYMDARLITKPDSNWLCAKHIVKDTVEEKE